MSGEHSILAPSSSARRVQCSGSTVAEAANPQTEDSPEAAQGTAAHWGCAEMLAGRLIDVGQVAPNGVYLTAEMVEAADLYCDDVQRELASFGVDPDAGQIEQSLPIKRVHPQSWGTPDFRIWLARPATRLRLLIYDFKFGHRVVEAFENAQCVEYVAGALDEAQAKGIADVDIDVTVKIVQPRAFHRDGPIRSWSFNASDIRALVNIASGAAHEALGPNARFRVGTECRDCRARHACVTLQRAAMDACDVAGQAQPFDLPVAAMALEYRTLQRHRKLLGARESGLQEQLLALGKRGAPIPGLRIEHGAGRERFTVPDDVVIQIGAALGVNVARPPEAMTPKQAVKAGMPPEVLAGIVNTPRGEAKLVEDDGSLARRIFG